LPSWHYIYTDIGILSGCSLEELAMPDLDLIKQGEQVWDPREAAG
jgi:hypothetical protein